MLNPNSQSVLCVGLLLNRVGIAFNHSQSRNVLFRKQLGLRAQELCESRGGRPELPKSLYSVCGRKAALKNKKKKSKTTATSTRR